MTLIILAALLLPVWGYALASTWAAWRFSRRQVAAAGAAPPISVLKPLHGAESGLGENLRSFADQDYPSVQIVLGVRSSADGAVPIVEALIESRPGSDIALHNSFVLAFGGLAGPQGTVGGTGAPGGAGNDGTTARVSLEKRHDIGWPR